MMKRHRFTALLCMILALSLLISGPEARAAGKAGYRFTKIDRSQTFDGGTFLFYFKYPKLKGTSKAIQKINKTLEKEGKTFVNSMDYSMGEIEEFITRDYKNYHTKCEYFNTVDGSVGFNRDNIFSIQYASAWFVGGVSNYNSFGDTFNLKTGKKLNITQVVSETYTNPAILRNQIHDKLYEKYDASVSDGFYEKYGTDKALKQVHFFINKKGNVIVCFPTYDLSYGAAGCLTVTLPSRFK